MRTRPPRSNRSWNTLNNRIVLTAQLKTMIAARGISAENTLPEDQRLYKWYCEASSSRIATVSLRPSVHGSGQTVRPMTYSAGMANTT